MFGRQPGDCRGNRFKPFFVTVATQFCSRCTLRLRWVALPAQFGYAAEPAAAAAAAAAAALC
jgi:hypothetical protein